MVLSNTSEDVRELTIRVGEREEIGRRLREELGGLAPEAAAAVMGVSRPRLSQMMNGDVPNAWLYLAHLIRRGYNVRRILTGE